MRRLPEAFFAFYQNARTEMTNPIIDVESRNGRTRLNDQDNAARMAVDLIARTKNVTWKDFTPVWIAESAHMAQLHGCPDAGATTPIVRVPSERGQAE
jgi:hypothetical protein